MQEIAMRPSTSPGSRARTSGEEEEQNDDDGADFDVAEARTDRRRDGGFEESAEIVVVDASTDRGGDDDHDADDDDDDDDDDVQVVSGPRTETEQPEKSSSSSIQSSRDRKRQRSPTDGGPFSKRSAGGVETGGGGSRSPSFRVASYNVWFGPNDEAARMVHPKERMEAIAEELRKAASDDVDESGPLRFIGLQELTPALVGYLEPCLRRMGYRLCAQPTAGIGYGVGIAVPDDLEVLESRFVPYRNSMQGRGFLFVRTDRVLFATTHLESWCGPGVTGADERETQIAVAAEFCRDRLLEPDACENLEVAIVTGDLNWDDERKRATPKGAPNSPLLSVVGKGWRDAGTPFDHTYDSKENPMLSGNLRRRFDRCLSLSRGAAAAAQYDDDDDDGRGYRSRDLIKIGTKAIPGLTWRKRNPYNGTVRTVPVAPSDHFGIVAHFSSSS